MISMSNKINMLDPHDDYMYVKKKGIIDLQQLFADIRKWYVSHQYELHEEDHKIKTPSPIGTEEELFYHAFRNEDDYTRWWINIRLNIWDSAPVEVMKGANKETLYRCRIKVRFQVQLELDYENKLENSAFLQGLRDFYYRSIIRRKVNVEGDKFEYEFHDIQDMIKRDLGIDASGDQYAHFWK